MRSPLTNPFSPGSDTVPQVWAGRVEHLSDWRDVVRPRLLAGLPERGRIILGEPGLGKSSLARRIARDAALGGDWVTAQLRIPAGTDPLKRVAEALLQLAADAGLATAREARIAALLSRVESVSISGSGIGLGKAVGQEPYRALFELLLEIGRAAMRRGNVVLIHLDEMQNIAEAKVLSQLLIAFGDAMVHEEEVEAPGGALISRTLPIAVYLTGLPDFADSVDARRGATFARRFKVSVLGAISDEDLTAALRPFVVEGWATPDDLGGTQRVVMEPAAAELIVAACKGEPFLFQLAGEQAWYAGTGDVITEAEAAAGWRTASREATSHVERILERLPPREREFLEAMAQLPARERSLKQITQSLGLDSSTKVGTTAQRLDTVRGIVERGRPYAFRHRAVEAYLTSDWPTLQS